MKWLFCPCASALTFIGFFFITNLFWSQRFKHYSERFNKVLCNRIWHNFHFLNISEIDKKKFHHHDIIGDTQEFDMALDVVELSKAFRLTCNLVALKTFDCYARDSDNADSLSGVHRDTESSICFTTQIVIHTYRIQHRNVSSSAGLKAFDTKWCTSE